MQARERKGGGGGGRERERGKEGGSRLTSVCSTLCTCIYAVQLIPHNI